MNYDIANPELAGDGARRVEWAGRRMQVLATVRESSSTSGRLEHSRAAIFWNSTTSARRRVGSISTLIVSTTPRH